jgi:hypothetical protein
VEDPTTTLQHVTSKDGTGLAYERLGQGPHVGQGHDAGPEALAAATKAFLT